MKSTSFSISIEAVMTRIYALSALREIQSENKAKTPVLLTRNEAPALKPIVKDAFAAWAMNAARWMTNVDFDNEDTLDFTLTLQDEANGLTIRRNIERALALKTMALVLTGVDSDGSVSYESDARAAIEDTIRQMAGCTASHTISHWL